MKKNYILILIAMISLSGMQAQKTIERNREFKKSNITKEEYLKSINALNLYPEEETKFIPKVAKTRAIKAFPDFEFANGINIAWFEFAADLGLNRWAKGPTWEAGEEPIAVQFDKFREVFKKVAGAGGKVIRWWLHTNGTATPIYGTDNKTKPTPEFIHNDIIKILDIAKEEKVKVQICLWSFDMAKKSEAGEQLVGKDKTKLVNLEANEKLLKEPEYMKAYFDNALIPMVTAVGNHDGLYAWEIFNEPEGMADFTDWGPDFVFKLTMSEIQKFVNKAAAAIRSANSDVKITSSAWAFKTSVNDRPKGFKNMYTDEELFNAGGETTGILDFYNIHYYAWAGTDGSPFVNNFDKYSLDKPTIIAEYYPNNNNNSIERTMLANTLRDNGWHGSLSWSLSDAEDASKQDGLAKKADTPEAKASKKTESDYTYTFEDMLQIIKASSDVLSSNNFTKFDNNNKSEIEIQRVDHTITMNHIPNTVSEIVIYSITGVLQKTCKINNDHLTIDISNFSSGIYLISYLENNKLFARKIIK